jgi:hypothetical protein
MFELWDFERGAPPDFGGLRDEAGFALRERAALRPQLEAIAERFQASPLYRAMRGAGVIRREVPFLLDAGAAIVSGTMDALLPDATIVDYKTGTHHPASAARYATQLRLYAAAHRALAGILPPRGILYYVDSDCIEEIAMRAEDVDDVLHRTDEVLTRINL